MKVIVDYENWSRVDALVGLMKRGSAKEARAASVDLKNLWPTIPHEVVEEKRDAFMEELEVERKEFANDLYKYFCLCVAGKKVGANASPRVYQQQCLDLIMATAGAFSASNPYRSGNLMTKDEVLSNSLIAAGINHEEFDNALAEVLARTKEH